MVHYKNTVVSWGKTASVLKISQKAAVREQLPQRPAPSLPSPGAGPQPGPCVVLEACPRTLLAAGGGWSQPRAAGAGLTLEVRAFLLGLAVTTQRAAQQSSALPGFLFLLQGAVYSIFFREPGQIQVCLSTPAERLRYVSGVAQLPAEDILKKSFTWQLSS